jgi:hypothetical protein
MGIGIVCAFNSRLGLDIHKSLYSAMILIADTDMSLFRLSAEFGAGWVQMVVPRITEYAVQMMKYSIAAPKINR